MREIAGNASEDRAESRKMAELIAIEQCTSDDLARLNLQFDPFPEGRHARGCPGGHLVQKIAGLVGPGPEETAADRAGCRGGTHR